MTPRILTVAMQKGGVGKTTIATNLAGALAGALGQRVLVIDFDDQCNTTTSLLGKADSGRTVEDVLLKETPMADVQQATEYCERLAVVAGSPKLPVWEDEIRSERWDRFVVAAHQTLPALVPPDVDIVLFDTPPTLGLWMQVALAASDGVLIVARPDRFSRDGLARLQETIGHVRNIIHPDLRVEGIVLNAVKEYTNLHSGYLEAYREIFADLLLEPHIPERQIVQELQIVGRPIEFYADNSQYPRDMRERFRQLARAVLRRLEKRTDEPIAARAAGVVGV